MKYHLTIATNTATVAYSFEDKASALERYHSELAYAYNQHLSILAHLTDGDGKLIKNEKYEYVAPVPEPEEETEPVEE